MHTHAQRCISTQAHIQTCTHTYTHTKIHRDAHTQKHKHGHKHTHRHAHTQIHTDMHMDTSTHRDMHTHTYIHTQIQRCTYTVPHTHPDRHNHTDVHTLHSHSDTRSELRDGEKAELLGAKKGDSIELFRFLWTQCPTRKASNVETPRGTGTKEAKSQGSLLALANKLAVGQPRKTERV